MFFLLTDDQVKQLADLSLELKSSINILDHDDDECASIEAITTGRGLTCMMWGRKGGGRCPHFDAGRAGVS
jgi:hypothetical protein